jgi:hypothetical protein
MTQIPILSGIYADTTPALRTAYPVNFFAVPKENGISQGFLRPGDGLTEWTATADTCRGQIVWQGVLYAVIGADLCSVSSSGVVTTIGSVSTDGLPVTLDYGFDDLAIASDGNLFLYNPTAGLRQNVDPDLGTVNDVLWVDGYYMTTDGEFLVVTELNNPLAVNPLKYGSSEADPDPIIAILKLRNEVVALNRHTIEMFDNIGGSLFPFQRIEGAQVEKGCIGKDACCIYMEAVAFLGSGFNEQPSVYVAANANAVKISTHEIDTLLEAYTEAELSAAILEARNEGSHQFLYMHLPDRTLVYDGGASRDLQAPVWTVLTSTLEGFSQYRARHLCYAYNAWRCADPQANRLGYLRRDISSHYGQTVRWEFGTLIVYNGGSGVLFNALELMALTGSVALGEDPAISTSYSIDGLSWSIDRTISLGTIGNTTKRLLWSKQGKMTDRRIQRFQGTSDAHASFMRLEAALEPLAW